MYPYRPMAPMGAWQMPQQVAGGAVGAQTPPPLRGGPSPAAARPQGPAGAAGAAAAAAAAAYQAMPAYQPGAPPPLMQGAPWAFQQGDGQLPQPSPAPGTTNLKFVTGVDTCALCIDDNPEMFIYLKCNHYPFCPKCTKRQGRATPGMIKCPVCSEQVKEVRKIKRVCLKE